MIKLALTILLTTVFAVELKWTAKEKALIKKVKEPGYFIEVHKQEIRERSEKAISYVLEAYKDGDHNDLISSLKQVPFHRFNDWEERQMMIEQAKKLDDPSLLEEK